MKRVTISVDEATLETARSDVAAGRAASVSAWVGDAMRHKLLARAKLLTELDEMAATTDTIDWVAETLRRPRQWVAKHLRDSSSGKRRAG
ncbi:MAG: hypothetical protein M3Z25_09565 [Actinomycetota bacterium]|nr:hypothetical protein [Actinomycetota bacterium]